MNEMKTTGRRRWPFVPLAVVLGLLDLFMIIVLITGALDTTDTDGKTLGMIFVGIVVAILSWLTWLCVRAWIRRGRPEQVVAQPTESRGLRPPVISKRRRVGGALLAVLCFSLAAVIAGVVITQLSKGHISGQGGGVTGFVLCMAFGTLGVTTARTPSSAERARFLGELARAEADPPPADGSAAPYPSPYPPSPYGTPPQYGAPPPSRPSWLQAPVNPAVTYREAMSQTPWWLPVATVALPAVLIWCITLSPPGWVIGVIALLLVVPVFLLVDVLIYAPYGIRLSGGTLSIGAHGVPRIGRGWRRQEIPLQEVLAWTICKRSDVGAEPPRSPFPGSDVPRPPVAKQVSNWGNFTGFGVRDVLVVSVDPSRVPAVMPMTLMSGYAVQDASATLRDSGVYVIGTHHADRLAKTLEEAVPSRRALT